MKLKLDASLLYMSVKYQQVFEDEEKIKKFLEIIGEFSPSKIDQEEKGENVEGEEEVEEDLPWKDSVADHKIVHLK